jgi:LysM repeat protein
MLVRLSGGAILLLICFGLSGCFDPVEGPVDEQKNPYFQAGKERVSARDYKGAIEAFEKALEINPHSALAHFELGVLYEQHDEEENHFVVAMYHYKRTVDLRPNAYPADNARLRIAGCRQELVKSESLAPVYQTMQRDLDRLKEENLQLRRQLEAWQAQAAGRIFPPVNSASASNQISSGASPTRTAVVSIRNDASINGSSATPPRDPAGLPPVAGGATRLHTVKQGDTPSSIARQYRVKVEALLAANPALEPRRLRVGQSINIPSS